MRAIWSNEKAEFHGEFVNFDPIWCWPKPVQPGGPTCPGARRLSVLSIGKKLIVESHFYTVSFGVWNSLDAEFEINRAQHREPTLDLV
jgi:hypothetical protein